MNNIEINNTPLMEAIIKKDYEVAKQIIESGIDVNAKNSNEETAFMMFDLSYISIPSFGSDCDMNCKIEKVINVMSFLLNNGADINDKNKDGQTIFMKYVNHYFQITKFLIEEGANINDVNNLGKTPLFYAMQQQTCLYANAVMNYNCNKKLWFIEYLIDNGAEINIMTKDKTTPLMTASQMKSDQVVEFLIKKGANIDEQDENGETALLKVLNRTNIGIPKSGATDENIFNTLKVLLDAKADTSIKNAQDKTPFMLAVENNLADAIKLFIINGVNPIKENIDIHSLFVKSLWYNDDFELSNFLLNNGFDINSLDDNKNTPLLSVVQDKYKENIIRFLIDNGADINLQNEFGYTPLMLLIRDLEDEEDRTIILHFIEKSENINTTLKDNKLITAHTIAIINEKEKFAKILKDKGADTSTTLKYLLKNDLYFEKEYFEKMLEALLPQEIKHIGRLALLESWSYFDKRIDVDKIDKCIFLLDKLNIKIGKENEEQIIGLSITSMSLTWKEDIKQELENNLFTMESKTFEDVLKQFIDFPEKNYELSKILKKFSNNDNLKYSNHNWESSTMISTSGDIIELNYSNFKNELIKGWKEIDASLEIYASTLHKDIKSFLFDDISKDISLFGETINCGWSSRKLIEEKLSGLVSAKKPEYYEDFQKMISIFKRSFVIKKYPFKEIFINLRKSLRSQENFDLSINLDDLKVKQDFKIFTDVRSLKEALSAILNEINDHILKKEDEIEKNNQQLNKKVKITIIQEKFNDKETVVLKIIHLKSASTKSAEELADNIKTNGGRFNIIYNNLLSICDWSIDTECKDEKRYKIDYLYPNIDHNKPHITPIDNSLEGFTYILRFYK